MRLLLLATCLLGLAKAGAQSVSLTPPAPQEFFRDYGRSFTPHHRLVAYFEAVAEASPRVHLEQYGTTYEGRPLMLAYISSAANIAQLEGLRQNHLRRSGLLEGTASGPEMAVVWLSNSVHGNEAAGSEASPLVLYALATSPAGDSISQYLDNTIVVLDPSLNPDGYTRYTDDQRRRATAQPMPHPAAWEHHEPWPGGRTNHYYFDLNRDWAWATQRETQARLRAYRRWMPHVHADLHEMGANSSYYFAPAAEPFHAYITDFQREFQGDIGRNHARLFDEQGWLYYTREVFDLLYPSYGDTYPTFNGAIGMTYEQGGSGRAGRAYLRREGDTLTLADRIAHHYTTSISTIAVSSRHAARLSSAVGEYRRAARDERRGQYEAYVFPVGSNAPARLQALTRLLDVHGIAYGAAKTDATVAGSRYGLTTGTTRVRKGDLVVNGRQAQGVLAQVLLDPVSALADSLTYDITAWSLPTVLGLEGFAATGKVTTEGTFSLPQNTSAATAPSYGFAVQVDGLAAWEALAPVLASQVTMRYAPKDARFGSNTVAAGSPLVLARDQQGSQGEARYRAAYDSLRAAGLQLVPLTGGMASSGYDLGSDAVSRVAAPRVALLQSDKHSPYGFGHVWHLFEQRLRYPIMPMPVGQLNAEYLRDIDVLIITDSRLDFAGERAEVLQAWVQAGGRLIAMEGSAEALGRVDGFALSMKEQATKLETSGSKPDPMAPYANRERAAINSNTPGALIQTQVDATHPIAFGLGDSFFALRTSSRPWAFLESGYNVIGVRENPMVRGFVGKDVRSQLNETLTLGVQPMGRGEVIYAADNLAYRGFWEHGMQVLVNAVFYR